MAMLFKKTTTRPMPAGPKIVNRTVKGETKRFAQWTDRKGKRRTAELTEAGDRIKTEAATWTAKYRDGEGKVCEVATGCRDKQAAQSVLDDLLRRFALVKAKVLSPHQDKIVHPICFAGLWSVFLHCLSFVFSWKCSPGRGDSG